MTRQTPFIADMRIAKDYRGNPAMIQLIGGEPQLAELERTIEATPALHCPFCGGEPETYLHILYGQTISVSIACGACRIGTPKLLEGQTARGTRYSLQDRLQQAITLWNRRA